MSSPYEPTLPILPYGDADTGRSSGWSGSDTSRDRAHAEDASGTTTERQRKVLLYLASRGIEGATWKDLATYYGWHHGQASGALSVLHKEGHIARLADERRSRCAVYVLPEKVHGRATVTQGRQSPTEPKYNNVGDEYLIRRDDNGQTGTVMSNRTVAAREYRWYRDTAKLPVTLLHRKVQRTDWEEVTE